MEKCTNCKKCAAEIANLKKRIKELEDELAVDIIFEEVATESKTQYEVLDLTKNHLQTITDTYYTEEFFYKGPKGVGEFICQHIIVNSEKYKCVDRNKILFHYREPQNPEVKLKDIKCKLLFERVFPILLKKIGEVYKKLINEAYDMMDNIIDDEDESEDEDIDELDYSGSSDPEEVKQEDVEYKEPQHYLKIDEIKEIDPPKETPLKDEIIRIESHKSLPFGGDYSSPSELTDKICDTYVEILKLKNKKRPVLEELINFSAPLD